MTNDKTYQIAKAYVQYMLDALKTADGEDIEYFLGEEFEGAENTSYFLDAVADQVEGIVVELEKLL
jgi:hypothetical protein